MRILCVHPGADFSVHDVYVGLAEALTRMGHAVGVYALNGHIEMAARYLAQQQARLRRSDQSQPRRAPVEEVMLKASENALIAALRGRADAVLVVAGLFFHPNALFLLRAARVPVGIVFTESPYQDDEQAEYAALCSVCWTNDRTSVEPLRRFNPRTYYLPAAYRAGVHCPGPVADDVPAHDVLFVGTLFQERADLLAAVDWSGVDFAIYGNLEAVDRRSAAARKLRRYVRGGVIDNTHALDLYRRAGIVLNPFRTTVAIGDDRHIVGESANPRTYELAAAGVFQLSSDRAEVRDLFGPSVPVFRDAAELGWLVRHYLAHPDERRALAQRAQQTTRGHSFDFRARQVADQLSHALLHNPFAVPAPLERMAAD